uniref:Coagulation factor V n=1 Tax=Pogona vitticeps TaxID=103695 RepID=A0A6J0SW27_9SAUR
MGTCGLVLIFKCLLMFLDFGWQGVGNPRAEAARLREYYIVAQVTSWNYSSSVEELSSLPKSDPLFKKIIYTEYEADFKTEKPRNGLSGLLGPTLRAEVGDTLVVHFKNLASKELNIHLQGILYTRWSKDSSYFDGISQTGRLDSAVPPGKTYKYVWEVTTEAGPREADPPCLTYSYYSHINMVQDYNSGLIGPLLICKEGSLNEDGTQKLFDKEYVLMFGVFDESKSWQKAPSLVYTINGYANGTLPDVQACAYDRISWHLMGMSSGPELFSIHFNGQTLEHNRYKVSTVNLVGGASATANMSVSKTGRWLISSLVAKHLQAGMHGYLNVEDCGNPDTLTRKLSFKELRMIKDWDYFIAAEEIIWDYAPDIPDTVDRKYKAQYLENFSNLIGKKYKKAVFRQYKDESFSKRIDNTWSKEHGILGPVIRAQVRDRIKIVFKNMASRPYSIYVHGVTLSKDAEGAVYPSDSKENITEGKAVQPGEIYIYEWTVHDTDEPSAKDAQCITRLYHSAVDVTRDIASGLIGPLLICKRKALDKKGIQNKADEEQHAVFTVFDENQSWYLEDNIKEYSGSPSTVKKDDPKFYRSNVMHTINGYASDRTDILGFCQSEIVEWHLASVGIQDEIVPVHLSGHTFLSRRKEQDILNLFPMSGESATVTMDNIGTWLLSSWGSREMNNGMRLRFRDAKCDKDYEGENEDDFDEEEDDVSVSYVNVVKFAPEKAQLSKGKEKENRGVVVDDSQERKAAELGFLDEENKKEQSSELNGVSVEEEEDEEQRMFAAMLGLRSFNGSDTKEEELNLTAIAVEEEVYSIRSDGDGFLNNDSSGNSHQEFTNNSDPSHGDRLQEILSTTSYPTSVESFLPNTSLSGEISFSDITGAVSTLSSQHSQDDHEDNATQTSGIYTQTLEPQYLRTNETDQSKIEVKLVSTNAPFLEKEENETERDTSEGRREKRILSEATLFALKEMCALLLHVQQKGNLSTLDNTTSKIQFRAVPTEEDALSLNNVETDDFLYDYEDDKEEEMTEPSWLSTNLTLVMEEMVEVNGSDPQHVPELAFSRTEKYDNLTLDSLLGSFVSPPIPKAVKNMTGSPRQRPKCPPKKTVYEWNAVSEKTNDETQASFTKDAYNELQNNSQNATMFPENTTLSSKRNLELYKNDSPFEIGQPEISKKHEALNEKRNENCTIKTSGTFIKARRKTKPSRVLTARTSKPLMTPRGFSQTSVATEAKDTMPLNETNDTHTQNQVKPVVTIGLPIENGDYQEYVLDNVEYEDSSSDSYEFQTVYYDNPYTGDSRLDPTTVRDPDDIAGRYLRALKKGGNVRRYYIAAEEIFWDYAAHRKSTARSGPTRTVYKKVVFRSYKDDTFMIPNTGGEYEEHLGILGPVIRAEVEDVIQVQFKNLASRTYSLHAHGLYYEKSSEGRSYNDQSPEWFRMDDAILPNHTYTYVWHATKRSGPAANQKVCKSWAYYSAVNPEKDINSGLIGPILICQKGMLDEYNRPIDMREFVLFFMVFDEEKSWYFNKHDKKTLAERSTRAQQHHIFPAINGVPYQLQGLRMYKDEEVHWHLLNMGGPKDIHVIHFHGHTFVEQGMEDHQLGVYPLLPGSFTTVEMKPSKIGTWLLETEVSEYQEAGMQAFFTVIDKECRLPMGLESGIIQDSQISASGHTGYWKPQLARLNGAGKYNAWSTEKKSNEHPWIQVDLQREVLITGVKTQGAMQMLKHLYIMDYFITYSKNGRKWNVFKGNHTGTQKLFEGNSDGNEIKENRLDPPILARYIRLYPNMFYNRPALRMELLGCETGDCSMPLGMENGAITNAQITASSYKKTWWSSWEPSLARLNLKGRTNAWQAKSNNNQQWLQIDLLQPKKITGIITQGAKSMTTEMYVKTFAILYSDDNSAWTSYLDDTTSREKMFTGNINSRGQVKHFFKPPIFSRFIRVIPKTWNQSIALRIELFGCDAF